MTNSARIAIARGFTLIETLMAVLLLSIAIAGPLTIASQGVIAATVARDQDTAFFLAQDAVEYVRFVRDTNKLNGSADWLAALDGTPASWGSGSPTIDQTSGDCTGTNGCYVDSLQNTIDSCGSSACSQTLYFDPANHFYCYPNGVNGSVDAGCTVPTIFTRAVTITTPVGSNSDEAAVTVTVSWCDQSKVCGTSPRSVTVREDIFNWQ